MSKPGICFVALHAYPVLSGRKDIAHIGGAEVQQMLIARGLLQRGYRISFVTEDHGQADGGEYDGLRVFKAYRPGAGVHGIRFLHPILTGLWRAMGRANADIYYNRMSEMTAGAVAAFCQWRRRQFLFATAHVWDCIPSLPTCKTRRERLMYRYGLRHADRVVSQTGEQQRRLRENFRIDSTIIHNCGRDYGCLPHRGGAPGSEPGNHLLWIGRFAPEKELDRLLDVARACPEFQFDVVGESDGSLPNVGELVAQARAMPNVHLHGRIPYSEMRRFYAQAAGLICTAREEGFPNTFLEAWSYGLPVFSVFDPDGMVGRHGLGIAADDTTGLIMGIRTLLGDPEAWRRACHNARRHFLEHHTVDSFVDRFEQVLEPFLASISPSQGVGMDRSNHREPT